LNYRSGEACLNFPSLSMTGSFEEKKLAAVVLLSMQDAICDEPTYVFAERLIRNAAFLRRDEARYGAGTCRNLCGQFVARILSTRRIMNRRGWDGM